MKILDIHDVHYRITLAVAQFGDQNMMKMMMMQELMKGSSGSGSSPASGTSAAAPAGPLAALGGSTGATGSSGMMGGIMGMMNNPALLCRNTENLTMLPCRRWRGICDIMSMQTYGFPGLMKCSPIGFGCCIKDLMSYTMIQNL